MVYTIVVHLYAKDSAESISKLHNKLLEASDVYCKDRETISWFVMQDHQDKRAFTILERFEHESLASTTDANVLTQCRMQSQKYHLENPYWKTFNPYVEPLLEKPMDIRRFNELESTR